MALEVKQKRSMGGAIVLIHKICRPSGEDIGAIEC
jgi:hypothetical protein